MPSVHMRNAKGALAIIELDDGSVIVAEMPRPRDVEVAIRYEDDDDWTDWRSTRLRPPRHELSISISGSPLGTYTYISREGVADWFAQRSATPWPDTPALDGGPREIGAG